MFLDMQKVKVLLSYVFSQKWFIFIAFYILYCLSQNGHESLLTAADLDEMNSLFIFSHPNLADGANGCSCSLPELRLQAPDQLGC